MNEKDLLRLKDEIDEAKDQVSELKGRKNYLLQELQSSFQCKTVKQGEKRISDIDEEIACLNRQISNELKNLEAYDDE